MLPGARPLKAVEPIWLTAFKGIQGKQLGNFLKVPIPLHQAAVHHEASIYILLATC